MQKSVKLFRSDCSEWESLALQYLEDVSYDTIPMHHIDGEGVTPTDRLKLGMVLGKIKRHTGSQT